MKNRGFDKLYLENNKRIINELKSELSEFLNSDLTVSAETTSILKFLDKIKSQIYIVPITTDTIESNICAEIISDYLKKIDNIFVSDSILIEGLQVKDNKKFLREGMPKLLARLDKYGAQSEVYLNFTGGYKGTIPYLTLWAQVNNVKMFYLYEESDDIIEVPQAPIDISWNVFAKYESLLSRLEEGIEISKEEFLRKNNLINTDFPDIIDEIDEDGVKLISLNHIGAIFLSRFRRFHVFYIPENSKYLSEEPNKKNNVNLAVAALIERLNSLDSDYNKLNDDILKHHVYGDGSAIYKFKKMDTQIRIHYKWDNPKLVVYNYQFVQSKSDDKEYSDKFRKEFDNYKKSKLISVTILKEN
jgi:putative CRISPR-associated protein (TIGR02619 family)